jgi:hypothetical protein
MIFQYLFFVSKYFLLLYFIEVITERIADSPHPKSFPEQLSRGGKDIKAVILMCSEKSFNQDVHSSSELESTPSR